MKSDLNVIQLYYSINVVNIWMKINMDIDKTRHEKKNQNNQKFNWNGLPWRWLNWLTCGKSCENNRLSVLQYWMKGKKREKNDQFILVEDSPLHISYVQYIRARAMTSKYKVVIYVGYVELSWNCFPKLFQYFRTQNDEKFINNEL